MSHPPLNDAGDDLTVDPDILDIGDPAEFDDEPLDDDVAEWPDPEGMAFYMPRRRRAA